jgi:hypothetical protein
MEMSTRYYADLVAIPMHLGFLIATGVANAGRWGTLEGVLLIAMEVVALLAHIFYIRRYRTRPGFKDEVNVYKWAEYSISATIGALAVLASSEEYPWQVPVAVAALGVAEQATGYTLDINVRPGERAKTQDYVIWSAAAAGQVCEFVVVGSYSGATAAFIFYVIFWSAYGGWCALSLVGRPATLNARETGYSLLSTAAKLSVFIASGFALRD